MGYIGVVLLLSLGGFIGTSLIAEQSNPGDTLYTLKTGINKDIKESLAMGAYAEGKLQIDLIEDRINEKIALISENRLTVETNNEINARISENIQKYLSLREKIQVDNNIEDYQALETRFEGLMAQNQDIESSNDFETSTGTEINTGVIQTGETQTGNVIDDILDTDINLDLDLNHFDTGTTNTGNTNTGEENGTGIDINLNSANTNTKVVSENDGFITVISYDYKDNNEKYN